MTTDKPITLMQSKPKASPNYLSLAVNHSRHAISPVIQQWSEWTAAQRTLAVCIAAPILAGPLMTIAFFGPVLVGLAVVGYLMLGANGSVDVAKEHWKEAMEENFGNPVDLDSLKKKVEEGGERVVGQVLQVLSVMVRQVLIYVSFILDKAISVFISFIFIYY